MKISKALSSLSTLSTVLVLTIAPVQVSSATDYHSGYSYSPNYSSSHSNYGHFGRSSYSNRSNHRYNRRHHNYNSNYSSYGGKNCRSTYKYQYDNYGERVRVNGTLCYDSYGKAYIVPGSRYVANNYH